MRPFVGQIVLYQQGGFTSPAIITEVWTDTCINLEVLSGTLRNMVLENITRQDLGKGCWSPNEEDERQERILDGVMSEIALQDPDAESGD